MADCIRFLVRSVSMRRYVGLSIALMATLVQADVLHDIVTKQYEARTLSSLQMDSMLAGSERLDEAETFLPQYRYELRKENEQKMFRHSFVADYYLWDKKKNAKIAISDTLIRDAEVSPNGQYVAYGKGQDLYIYKVLYKSEVPILEDSYRKGQDVFYGLSDWLYEEEFGITRMFWFSPESKQVAFVRLDEGEVPTFGWQTWLGEQYPRTRSLRYPKAGCQNAQASVCVYDISTKGVRTMRLPEMKDAYVPRLTWRSEEELVIERVSRDQNQLEVFVANPKSTVCTPIYTEKSEQYFVDYALFDSWQWLTDGRMVVLSEKGGWRQLYVYSSQGVEQKVLTPEGIDVTAVYGVDEKAGVVYFQAAAKPSERQIYAVHMKSGKLTQLSEGAGIHSMVIGSNGEKGKMAIASYESETQIRHYMQYSLSGSSWKALSNQPEQLVDINLKNDSIQKAWEALQMPQKQFVRISTERGDSLEAWLLTPNEMEAGKRYPVVMMQYSGPMSQRVLNRWRHRFAHYLALEGYVVVNVDVRGSDCRGRAWRNETYMQLGKKEAEDHLSVARYMQQLPYVDGERIAMMGWSYGGFQTIRTMMEQDTDLIKAGVAIAPVTDWRLYDSGYTERFMRRPQVNEDGYMEADLCAKAKDLKGNLLLVHATGDDNVHYQNSLWLIDALVKANKQFDTQLYIDDNHSLLDPINNEHLHRKMMLWLETNL